jgi:hypothetical protein
MNYKDKKYLSEDKWLLTSLNKFDFFVIAQLKSCDSKRWVQLQKDLSKLNLKIKLVNFRNLKNVSFFSELPTKTIESLFRGRIVLIYSNQSLPSGTIESIKSIGTLRPFLIYTCGRFLNIYSDKLANNLQIIDNSEWYNLFSHLGGYEIHETLSRFKRPCVELVQTQHSTVLDLLVYKVQNENKF